MNGKASNYRVQLNLIALNGGSHEDQTEKYKNFHNLCI